MKNPNRFFQDIIVDVLKQLQNGQHKQKSLRIVSFQPKAVEALGVAECSEHVNRAFAIRFYGGVALDLAVTASQDSHDLLLRRFKEMGRFIPLIVETGTEKLETLTEHIKQLFLDAFRYLQREQTRRQHTKTTRSSRRFYSGRRSFAAA